MATPLGASLQDDPAPASPEGAEPIAGPSSKPPPEHPFSWTPLAILAGTCVGLGMLPAFGMRRRLVQQGRLLQQIRAGIHEGNARIIDLKRVSEVSEIVDGIHEKEIERLRAQIQELILARRDTEVLASERERALEGLKETIRTTEEHEKQRNALLASLGDEMSDAFGRIANFQEEVQLRNGMDSQYDRHGIHRMRALARRLQDLTNKATQGQSSHPPVD